MILPRRPLLCACMLVSVLCPAQPDFLRQATAVAPATPDPAIARALGSIDPARIEQTIEALVEFGTRNALTSMETGLAPGQGVEAAADWIEAEFKQISAQCNGCLEVNRDAFVADPSSGSRWARRVPRPTRMTNIYAILRGADPAQARRLVLVTGHYDSINSNVFKSWSDTSGAAPGANDDASGVAVSLECARVLSKLQFPASIVFVAVDGEEEGLIGSAHLAHLAREQGWQLEAVLNNDIVGGNTTPGDTLQLKDRVRVFSEGVPEAATPEEARRIRALGEEDDSPSRELARAIADTARGYFPSSGAAAPLDAFSAFLVFRPDRYGRGGDHSSFNEEGFAAVRFTEWREDYNHQHQNVVYPPAGSSEPILGDLPRFVDFKYVADVARLNAATLATLASAPGEPQKVTMETQKQETTTTLHWESPEGAPAATHYELLWRETTAPDWQYAQTVQPKAPGKPVTVTVPISKDNVVFGVRAVDAAGHRSPAVAP
ncbi:MAG TPA: M20/M25/M40 family metallo-hydrolase [Terracidiphilus sp.]|nr:M20/M25/M40 family metallo-hydrolase [Terracidiphilus sp.]